MNNKLSGIRLTLALSIMGLPTLGRSMIEYALRGEETMGKLKMATGLPESEIKAHLSKSILSAEGFLYVLINTAKMPVGIEGEQLYCHKDNDYLRWHILDLFIKTGKLM